MDKHIIDFRDIQWEEQRPGVRFKSRIHENTRMRLVEFDQGLIEEDWCLKGHIGYVLEGCIEIEFEEATSHFRQGDGIYISEGTKHRASVPRGSKAVIVFVEKA